MTSLSRVSAQTADERSVPGIYVWTLPCVLNSRLREWRHRAVPDGTLGAIFFADSWHQDYAAIASANGWTPTISFHPAWCRRKRRHEIFFETAVRPSAVCCSLHQGGGGFLTDCGAISGAGTVTRAGGGRGAVGALPGSEMEPAARSAPKSVLKNTPEQRAAGGRGNGGRRSEKGAMTKHHN